MKNSKKIILVTVFMLLTLLVMSITPPYIAVEYRCAESAPITNQIKPHVNIVNNTAVAVNLADLKIRYYYIIEDSAEQQISVDYARIGASKVNGKFVQFSENKYYLEVSFVADAGMLEPEDETGEIQLRMNKVNWTNYDQENDYSFNPDIKSFTEYEKITLYQNDELIWGMTESDITLNITKSNWSTALEDVNGVETGIVYLDLAGNTSCEKVTVHTWMDNVPADVVLTLDTAGNFDQKVAVCNSATPDDTVFNVSTSVTAFDANLTIVKDLQSSELQYKQIYEWIPYDTNNADINIIEENGVYKVQAIMHFDGDGFRVIDWGTVTQSGNVFSADAKVEIWTGPHILITYDIENVYDLGALESGDYTFILNTYSKEAGRKTFTVQGTIIRTLEIMNSGEGAGYAVVGLSPPSLEGLTEIETPASVTYNDGEIVSLETINIIAANNGSYYDGIIGYDGPLTMDEDKSVYYNFKNSNTEGLALQYKCMERSDSTNSIRAHFNIVNDSSISFSLSELTVRYYYTLENPSDQQFHCDHAQIGSGNVAGTFVNVEGDEYYLEIGFPTTGVILTPNSQSGEIQTRWNKTDWSNMIQTNDYSFNPDLISYTNWEKIEIFHSGAKVWPNDGTTLNYPPTVNITSPADGMIFDTGASFTIEADAADSDGTVTSVEFYINDEKVGEDTASPYVYTVSNLTDNNYNITVKAIDDKDAYAVSSVVAVRIGNEPVVREIDPAVKLNTIGFLPGREKKASISENCSSYVIRDAETNNIVYTGTISSSINSTDTSETVFIADFTAFDTSGKYYMDVEGVGQSPDFLINDAVYDFSFYTTMRGMYLWRSGTAVSGVHNGVTFSHAPSHLDDGYYDYIDGSHTKVDGTGGWYDAGDYGKYVVNAGITVGMMFKAWEHFQTKLETLNLDIPESGGTLPDYLAEMKWEIDWLLKMQYTDGSGRVSHKLTRTNFSGFIMPENDNETRYFVPWGSAATADFTAMLAMAARIFKPYDEAYAQRCLDAALVSYQFLKDNPGDHAADQSGFSTGEYGTTDPDDRLWAAAELWETTGDVQYLNDFENRVSSISPVIDTDFDWGDVSNLGMITYLESSRAGKNSDIVNNIQTALLSTADEIVNTENNNAYGRPLGGEYYWGCNGTVARQTLILQSANKISPNADYINTALDAVSHVFGRNYYQRSYVTGLGYNPPMFPHDRRSGADGISDPWPGYLVGGGHSATGWIDLESSYQTNEIAVNWNGALIYALAGFIK